MQPRGCWPSLLQMVYCWFMFNFVLIRTPGPFLQTCFQSTLSWSLLFLTRSRTWHFTLFNVVRFLLAHFSCPLRSLWTAAQLSGGSIIAPRFIGSVNLLKLHLVPSPWSLMLNSTGLQYWLHHWWLASSWTSYPWWQHPEPSSSAHFQQPPMYLSRLSWSHSSNSLPAQGISWPSCHLLYTFFLYLHLVRSCLLIHAALLLPFHDFLLIRMDCSRAWRTWSLKISQLSWTSLQVCVSWDSFKQVPEQAQVCSPKSSVVILLFVLLSPRLWSVPPCFQTGGVAELLPSSAL